MTRLPAETISIMPSTREQHQHVELALEQAALAQVGLGVDEDERR